MSELLTEREVLFDEDFRLKSKDLNRIKKFCKMLCDETGIQVCNNNGSIYEYLPQVYNSVVKKYEMSDM